MASADQLKERGNALLKAGKLDDAIAMYTGAVVMAPHNHVMYGNRAAALLQRHQFPQALLDAQTCVQLEPTYYKGYSRIMSAYLGMGRLASALDACNAALAVLEEDGSAVDKKYFAGEHEKLVAAVRAAVAASAPDRRAAAATTPSPHSTLSETQCQLGTATHPGDADHSDTASVDGDDASDSGDSDSDGDPVPEASAPPVFIPSMIDGGMMMFPGTGAKSSCGEVRRASGICYSKTETPLPQLFAMALA
jgi:tetratricopeptide (TPR) repeat protein